MTSNFAKFFPLCGALAIACSDDPSAAPVVLQVGASGDTGNGGVSSGAGGGSPVAAGGSAGSPASEGGSGPLGLAGAPTQPVPPVVAPPPVALFQPPPPGTNLSLSSLSCASSEEGGFKFIPYAIDGNTTSMWCAANGNLGHYYGVDLGALHTLTGVRMQWEFEDRVYQYRVEISSDGETWDVWVDQSANDAVGSVVHARAGEARYVRIGWNGLQALPVTWSCMIEFEVWGIPLLDAGSALDAGIALDAGFPLDASGPLASDAGDPNSDAPDAAILEPSALNTLACQVITTP